MLPSPRQSRAAWWWQLCCQDKGTGHHVPASRAQPCSRPSPSPSPSPSHRPRLRPSCPCTPASISFWKLLLFPACPRTPAVSHSGMWPLWLTPAIHGCRAVRGQASNCMHCRGGALSASHLGNRSWEPTTLIPLPGSLWNGSAGCFGWQHLPAALR